MLKTALWLVTILLSCGCASNSGDHSAARNKQPGFVPLFNGQDLAGWMYGTDAKGNPRKAGNGYQVRDGALYCTVADGGNLFTEKEYDNFVLRFQFRLTPGANNGVAIRAPINRSSAYDGIEIQILDDTADKYATLRPAQYHGSIYDTVAPQRGRLEPVGEWNEQEITARGRQITVKLNGHTIVEANLDEIKDPAVLKKHAGLSRTSGHIGFLGHGSEVHFRNVRIKQL